MRPLVGCPEPPEPAPSFGTYPVPSWVEGAVSWTEVNFTQPSTAWQNAAFFWGNDAYTWGNGVASQG